MAQIVMYQCIPASRGYFVFTSNVNIFKGKTKRPFQSWNGLFGEIQFVRTEPGNVQER